MIEIWKPVVGHEEFYEVSNLGRVKRIKRARGTQVKILKQTIYPGLGYPIVTLWMSNNRGVQLVHRLVAFAFLGNPPTPRHQVNHKDGNRANNVVENLEWVTCQENHLHRLNVIRNPSSFGEGRWNAKLTFADVREIRRAYAAGEASMCQLGKQFDVSSSHVSKIISRQLWARE